MTKTSRIGALIVVPSLLLAATMDEAAAQEATAVTTLYTSLLQGVGKEVGEDTVGWALSAIGLAGGSSTALGEIADELQAIDQELMDIENSLQEILDAIDDQTCVGTETQASLTDAVNNITSLYTTYQQDFIEPSQKGDPIILSQLDTWVVDVTQGFGSNLQSIHNALVGSDEASVIEACTTSVAQDYVTGDGPSENILDDRVYYASILNTINYYYGVQVQGATILVEALHLKACQQAAMSDPDLH